MLNLIYSKYLECDGVSIDSRKITRNVLFFAIRGPQFNGNEFALDALNRGARYAVVDEEEYVADDRFVLVKDSIACLQELANHHRRQFEIPVFGITGSNGKTTTKELIREVLATKYSVIATDGNLNNHIGVPLTLLRLHKSVELAIIEMGANQLGDIALLCEIAEPTHGLITNIGLAHTEGFGNLDGVIRGKSELYQYLRSHDGTAFINSGNEILFNMARRFEKPILFPKKGDFYHCELVEADPFVVIRTEGGEEVKTRLVGAYNFENMAAALCLGKFFEVAEKNATGAIQDYLPDNYRSQIIEKGSITIIMDAYNANPSSMQAALSNLASMKAPKKGVILGDMFELGQQSQEEHFRLGQMLSSLGLDHVWLCGPEMGFAHQSYPQASYFKDKKDLEKELGKTSLEDFTILIKASRGMKLETVVEHIH